MRATLSIGRLTICVLLALALGPGSAAQAPADKPRPLTPQQQARLKECGRLVADVEKLLAAGKRAEAVPAVKEVVAILREVYGDTHEEVVRALKWLAEVHE